MSALTKCNHCNLREFKRRYGEENVTVRQVPITEDMGGWIEVTVKDREKPIGWFLALGEECEC